MLLKTLAQTAAVLALTATAANAGLRASQDGDTLNINCQDDGCYVLVKPVGSRIHIFDLTGSEYDTRSARPLPGQYVFACNSAFLPDDIGTRDYTFAQAEITRIRYTGNGKNERFEIRGLEHAELDVDMKGGHDVYIANRTGTVLLGDGYDCANVSGGGTVNGQGGNDYITVRDGTFDVDGGRGSDEIDAFGYEGMVLKGGIGSDRIKGGWGDDVIYGQDGNDTISGKGGNDYIEGGDGADDIHGDDGDDTIYGGQGNDRIRGDDGDDYLRGNRGDDDVRDLAGVNRLYGDKDNDYVETNNAGSDANGGGGQDTCKVYGEATMQHCETVLQP